MADFPRRDELRLRVLEVLGDRMKPEFEPAVDRYVKAVELAERCWDAIPSRSILGKTDRGGQRVHPAIEAAIRAERAAAEFGQALGIEPDVKRKPGRPKAAVSAPDRAATPPRLRRVQ